MPLSRADRDSARSAGARDPGRPQAASPRFRAPACARPRALHRRPARARRACCISPSAARPRRRDGCVALDLEAVRAAPGVVAVLTAADIPGANDIAPVFKDEPLFATDEILYYGQPLFAVVAQEPRRGAARREARRASRSPRRSRRLTVEDALASGARVLPDYDFGRGDIEAALAAAPHRLEGKFAIGGQEHFYLEGQVSMAAPGEGREMTVYASTQDPTEVQHIVGAHPRHSRRLHHRRDAPHGRRLRRQGEPGLRLGGDGGARRACHRRAVQGEARPRRRFRADRQAPRVPRRLAHRLRRRRPRQRLRRRRSTPIAAARPTCRPASSTARCSTPPTATICPWRASPRGG